MFPSHGKSHRFKSCIVYHISDWRNWLARLLDMEKVIGSNPISETILLKIPFTWGVMYCIIIYANFDGYCSLTSEWI